MLSEIIIGSIKKCIVINRVGKCFLIKCNIYIYSIKVRYLKKVVFGFTAMLCLNVKLFNIMTRRIGQLFNLDYK